MMQGRVNQNCEVMLSIAVGHDDAPKLMVKALIDLGFSGFLSLPSSTIESLELPWIFSDSVTLGDGSEVIFQMYRAIPAHRLLFRSIGIQHNFHCDTLFPLLVPFYLRPNRLSLLNLHPN
jgi:hypothetical protein